MSPPQRRMTSVSQLHRLVEYMSSQDRADLARGHNSLRSKEGRVQCEEMWSELATILNAEKGARRTAKEWTRVWVDLKARVKKSVMFNLQKSKEGSRALVKLSPVEEAVARILGFQGDDDELDHTPVNTLRKQSTIMQLHLLAKFMNDNLRVAQSSIRGSEQRVQQKQYYEQISIVLNKEGPSRTPKEWSKVWIDLKCKVRGKLAKLAADENDSSAKLTQLEELVAVIINRDPDDESDDASHDDEETTDDTATLEQLEGLWQYLNEHRDVATSPYDVEVESFKSAWEEIADKLNAIEEGVVKDWKSWARFWAGYRHQLRSKVQSVINGAMANLDSSMDDDGEPTGIEDMEGRFLQILGEDFATEDNETTHKRTNEDHTYSENKKHSTKKIKKERNESIETDSDHSEDYFPENSHANATLQLFTPNKNQTSICTDCHVHKNVGNDESERNKSFLTLLTSELKYVPSCVRSDAYINILRYVNSLKSKHKSHTNNAGSYSTFEVLLNSPDPLSQG